jgi:hypothetical protein
MEAAVAEIKAEALMKPTGRFYLQDYVCSCVLKAATSHSYANILIPDRRVYCADRRFSSFGQDRNYGEKPKAECQPAGTPQRASTTGGREMPSLLHLRLVRRVAT